MASWHDIETEAPELADRVRRRFARGTNKTIATLRSDGAPRISAIELELDGGEATLGMMGGSVKLRDVRRDARVAIHSATVEAAEGESWLGDAKLAGTLVEVPAPADNHEPGAGFFRVEVTEVSLTYVGEPADHLVIESWDTAQGWRRRTH